MPQDIMVKCRNCGKLAPSSEFVVDTYLKLAVCKACSKGARPSQGQTKIVPSQQKMQQQTGPRGLPKEDFLFKSKPQQIQDDKPAGWDADDVYLDKLAKTKKENTVKAERLSDGRILYPCMKCKYQFKYSQEKNLPAKCPYCGTTVGKYTY